MNKFTFNEIVFGHTELRGRASHAKYETVTSTTCITTMHNGNRQESLGITKTCKPFHDQNAGSTKLRLPREGVSCTERALLESVQRSQASNFQINATDDVPSGSQRRKNKHAYETTEFSCARLPQCGSGARQAEFSTLDSAIRSSSIHLHCRGTFQESLQIDGATEVLNDGILELLEQRLL